MKKQKQKILEEIIIFLSIAGLIFGVYLHGIGEHNMDNVVNSYGRSQKIVDYVNSELERSNSTFKISLEGQTDVASDMIERPLQSYYQLAHRQIKTGFSLTLLSAFLLGMFLEKRL